MRETGRRIHFLQPSFQTPVMPRDRPPFAPDSDWVRGCLRPLYMYMHVQYICIYIYIVCVYIYIYSFIYTCIDIYISIYIHIMYSSCWSSRASAAHPSRTRKDEVAKRGSLPRGSTGFQTGSGQTCVFCCFNRSAIHPNNFAILLQYFCHNYVIIMVYCGTSAKNPFVLTPFGSCQRIVPSLGKLRRPRALRDPWGTICQVANLTCQSGENKHPRPTVSAWTLQCWSCG